MKLTEFKPDDIADYLNQELPGFEPVLVERDGPGSLMLRVRAAQRFSAYAEIAGEHLVFPVPNYHLQRWVDELIRKTREDLIQKLGLQKEIDAQVQRQVAAERQRIETEAYRKAMNDALSRVAQEQEKAREQLAAGIWNTFMGRPAQPAPVTTTDDDGLLDDC